MTAPRGLIGGSAASSYDIYSVIAAAKFSTKLPALLRNSGIEVAF
jgi:hypothetical protein